MFKKYTYIKIIDYFKHIFGYNWILYLWPISRRKRNITIPSNNNPNLKLIMTNDSKSSLLKIYSRKYTKGKLLLMGSVKLLYSLFCVYDNFCYILFVRIIFITVIYYCKSGVTIKKIL